ncbi:hypothetical protein JTY60_00820 [symbiont of Argiope bruennichi]|uniref:hypothetical protein n=1 Tax=symbiont of Argiope bruennichi TaxID=2810479 RepID=UPI003DA1CDA2
MEFKSTFISNYLTIIFTFLTIFFLILSWFLDKFFDKKSFGKKTLIKKTATSIMFADLAVILEFVQKIAFESISKFFQFPLSNIPLFLCGIFNGVFMGYLSGIIYDLILLFIGLLTKFYIGFTFTKGLIGFISALTFLIVKKMFAVFKNNKNFIISFFMIIFLAFIVFFALFSIINISKYYQYLNHQYGNKTISIILFCLFFFLLVMLLCLTLFFWRNCTNTPDNANIYLTIFLAFILQYLFISILMSPILLNLVYNIPYKISYLKIFIQPFSFFPAIFFTFFTYNKIKDFFF